MIGAAPHEAVRGVGLQPRSIAPPKETSDGYRPSGLAPAAVPLQQQALLSRFLLRLQGPVYNPKRDAPGDDSRLQHHFPWLATSLKGLSPYEYICSTWTKEPGRFILDPIHQMPGLNS